MAHIHDCLDILYVGTLPPHNGGTAIVGYQLLVGLANLGHRVRAIAPITCETLDAGQSFSRRYPELRISRYSLPFFDVSPNHPKSSDYKTAEAAAVVQGFEAAVSEQRPDLLIIGRETHAWHLPKLAVNKVIPSMLIVHGAGLFGMIHSFSFADRAYLSEQFRKVDLIVTVARHLEGSLRELGLPHPVTIPNPVDPAKFYPKPRDAGLMTQLRLCSDHLIIAHVSNMKALKRSSDIVASAREVINVEPRVIYLMVGEGPCRAQLENECRRLGIIDHFRFTGWVEHEKVADYMNLADAVVMPSETEAMALVYLETMACGRLLIASDIPAAREAVRDGQTGLLFPKGDVAELTRKTLLAANDPMLRDRIGSAAREWVKQHDVGQVVAAYEEAIRRLVGEHRKTA